MRWIDSFIERITHRHMLEAQIKQLREELCCANDRLDKQQKAYDERMEDALRADAVLSDLNAQVQQLQEDRERDLRLAVVEQDRTELFRRIDYLSAQVQQLQEDREWDPRLAVVEQDRTELFRRIDDLSAQVQQLQAVAEQDRTELFRRIDDLDALIQSLAEDTERDDRLWVLEQDRTELFGRTDKIERILSEVSDRFQEAIEVQNCTLLQSVSNIWDNVLPIKSGKLRIHFIRCLDIYNTGDMNCGPDLYFEELKKGNICFFHSIKNICYQMIGKHDWVILGGGGLLDCSSQYQEAINQLLNLSDHVIGWGLGHNAHYENSIFEAKPSVQIAYDKFFLFTSRDWHYENDRFCPCVSCMLYGLEKEYEIKRRIGVVTHHQVKIQEFDFDVCTNSEPIDVILNFIGTSEIIITNSYHIAYWATLMCKKVIIYQPFSNRFSYFKYPLVEYSGDLEADIERTKIYPQALCECRKINSDLKDELLREMHKSPSGMRRK